LRICSLDILDSMEVAEFESHAQLKESLTRKAPAFVP
jgi:hypothetical protein